MRHSDLGIDVVVCENIAVGVHDNARGLRRGAARSVIDGYADHAVLHGGDDLLIGHCTVALSFGFNVEIRRGAVLAAVLDKAHGAVVCRGVGPCYEHSSRKSHNAHGDAAHNADKGDKTLAHALFRGGGSGLTVVVILTVGIAVIAVGGRGSVGTVISAVLPALTVIGAAVIILSRWGILPVGSAARRVLSVVLSGILPVSGLGSRLAAVLPRVLSAPAEISAALSVFGVLGGVKGGLAFGRAKKRRAPPF